MCIRSAALFVVLCLFFCTAIYAGDADKLIGVWERVSFKNLDTGESNTIPLRLMISKKYWSNSLPNEDGQAELRYPLGGLLDRMIFRSGPYSVKGNMFIRHTDRCTNPRFEGVDVTDEFSFERDLLVLRLKNVDGHSIEKYFKRLE